MARAAWSKIVEEAGVQVRIFERERSSLLYRSVMIDGQKDRKSLGHRDKTLAEQQAKQLGRAIAGLQLAGATGKPATFGEVREMYLFHKAPLLKPARLHFLKRALELFAMHLEPNGRPFPMDDFGDTQAHSYAIARQTGKLKSSDPRSGDTVRAGCVRNELQALSAVCNWAVGFKRNGRRLLAHNPVRDIRMPKEENTRRPVATRDRFDKLVSVASEVDPSGQFRLMLQLAYHTGRRINAICHLRASDVLSGGDQVRRGLASIGWDESAAEEWDNAIIWRAEFDKKGFDWCSYVSAPLRAEIDAYVRRAGVVGNAWLFPYPLRAGEPTPKNAADWWLNKAERIAELPHQARGGWHSFRRAWATNRKGHALPDVMQAGGWKDPKALQRVYQAADAKSVRAVMEAFG